ncbi:hypothetical protein [Kutzneria sp. NPDC052558]|uniref:hypothetical protein n=1 Tax=Kutzneria sp. NPDC052558 TaxID=3364121 RepID=UPI0037CC7260
MDIKQFTTPGPTGATRRLSVRDLPVEIHTGTDGAAALLDETFYPPGMLNVRETSDEPELTIVDHIRTPAEIAALLWHAATGVAGTYELTRGFRQPKYEVDGHTVFTLRDENSDEVAAVIRGERSIAVVRPDSGLGDRWLTRIVRDTATRRATAAGSLVMHSSAFVFDGRAYLVIGDSGAGKSTTAIALSRLLPNAGWMGNDRMHLDVVGDEYRVTACPLPLAVNKGSLDVMGITDFSGWDVRAGIPGPESDWDQFHGEDKLKLSSREVNRYLEVDVVAESVLAGVLLPRVDREADYCCEAAKPDHVAEVLERNCFSLDDNLYGEDWLRVPVAARAVPPSLDDFLDHIARLPVLRCQVGSAADLAKLATDFRHAV